MIGQRSGVSGSGKLIFWEVGQGPKDKQNKKKLYRISRGVQEFSSFF